MSRIFEGQENGPPKIISGDRELTEFERRRAINLSLDSDPHVQRQFEESGKTREEFVEHYLSSFKNQEAKKSYGIPDERRKQYREASARTRENIDKEIDSNPELNKKFNESGMTREKFISDLVTARTKEHYEEMIAKPKRQK